MNIEKAVKEVQDRLELVGERSQGVAKVSVKTLKAANEIVVEGVQGVVAVQTAAAKDLYTAGKQSFDKAVAAGLVAVAKSPVEFLPEGRETIVGAFNETVDTVTQTGEKLAQVAKSGYQGIAASIQGKQIRKPVRKAARKVAATVAAA